MFKKNRKIIVGAMLATTATLLLNTSTLNAKSDDNKLEAYLKFTRVLNLVETQYVDELNSTTIINKAIKGLLSNLDAHSAYLDEKAFKDLNVQTKGEFGGLGIVVGMKKGVLTVIAPIDDTPAKRAGVKAGDIILKINDKSTLGMTIDEAVNLMRGKPKTKIKLTLVRKGESKPIVVEIIRDIIKIQSVKDKYFYIDKDKKKKALYVKISSFDANVVKNMKKILEKNKDAKGLIIDLRNNPGGLLSQATGLLDMFINKGILVSQKGRDKRENIIYRAHSNGKYPNIPITLLVNPGSASASEIVSGAMQDHRRGIIIGEKTFGKGSVQVVIPLGEKEAIKLTVARYYLPSGRTIQNKGVEPDIIVYPGEATKKKEDEFTIKEKELKAHLKTELEKIEEKNSTKENNTTKAKKKDKKLLKLEDINKDAQLKSGVDILKVLILKKEGNK